MKKMKAIKKIKRALKNFITNEITLKTIVVLCHVVIAIGIYVLLDSIFVF